VVLVILLRLKVKIGLAMVISTCTLALLLRVSPVRMTQTLATEWQREPLTQTTGYLFISLTALLLLVNVIGAALEEIGLTKRLVPAIQGLFKSRRFALALIPLIMGMLPTPGGIMLSAPMVREAGDKIGVERSRLAAINYLFRHQWEPVWPLFPAVPLIQGMLGISAFKLFSYHIALSAAGIIAGIITLLFFGIPPKQSDHKHTERHIGHHLLNFLHAFWPIAFTAGLYIAFNLPPAIGLFLAIIGLLTAHKVPFKRWSHIFKAALEPDMVLLIFGALLFKINLEAADAIGSVVQFLTSIHVPSFLLLFILPMLVGFSTGVTMPTVAITYPFLIGFINSGGEVKMGLEVLAFSGLIVGISLTPIHLCLALSASYFETSLAKIILKMLPPVAAIAGTGVLMAVLFG
jgi:integral membrane protein (TIGR00529 family)